MKTPFKIFPFLSLFMLFSQKAISQSTFAGLGALGHTGGAVATDWCGWNAATNIPFNLEHRGNQNINMMISGGGNPGRKLTVFQNGIAPSLNFGGGVGIHRNSAIPIAIPGALLHIGNDNIGLTSTDIGKRGWRNWMEIGTFMMGNTDNVYLGLKNEGSFNNVDRYDAILNWGDNSTSSPAPPPGPDYFRFVLNHWNLGNPNSNI